MWLKPVCQCVCECLPNWKFDGDKLLLSNFGTVKQILSVTKVTEITIENWKLSTPEPVYNEPQGYADEKTDDHLETVQPKKHHVWLIDASKSGEMHFIKYTPKCTWTVYNLNIIFLAKLY